MITRIPDFGLRVLMILVWSSLFTGLAEAVSVENGFIAWSRWTTSVSGVIEVANLDGSAVQTIVTTNTPLDLAAHQTGDIYYTKLTRDGLSGSPGEVYTTDPTGTQNTLIYTADNDNTLGAIDLAGTNLYWSESLGVFSPSELHTSDLNGSNESVIPVANPDPISKQFGEIRVDQEHGSIFWSFADTNSSIVSSNLDGSNSQTILPDLFNQGAFDLDKENQLIYYSGGDFFDSSIFRSNYDGTDVLEILDLGVFIGNIEYDEATGWLYWQEGNSKILRANLNDLANIEPVVSADGLRGFVVVTPVPIPSAFLLLGSGLIALFSWSQLRFS